MEIVVCQFDGGVLDKLTSCGEFAFVCSLHYTNNREKICVGEIILFCLY